MDAKCLTALKGSIKKWEKISEGTGVDRGPENCPLCKLFFDGLFSCVGCPVAGKTKRDFCNKTPYEKWTMHHEDKHHTYEDYQVHCPKCTLLATQEVKFLKSLLPTKKVQHG